MAPPDPESCCYSGPRKTPLEAMNDPPEKVLYVLCLQSPENRKTVCDYIATVDADPSSPTYSTVLHRLYTQDLNDEVHHFGWNSCVSCTDPAIKRRYLIIPVLKSGNIYIVDTIDPVKLSISKVMSGRDIADRFNLTYPHTTHCIPSGQVMISYMGDAEGKARGAFLLLDGTTFEPVGLWNKKDADQGYDFWYQPKCNLMVSSEFGVPNSFMKCFDPKDVAKGDYGSKLNFWDWKKGTLSSSKDLGASGKIPLELRFLHNPDAEEGFVAAALGSSIFRIHKNFFGYWTASNVVQIPPKKVEGWMLPAMPSLITDILISLDDKYLYLANFLHGDVRQYDITDTSKPKQVSQVFCGGSICKGEGVKVTEDLELEEQPERLIIKETVVRGSPNMLQLSKDGKRLYVTFSLLNPWDQQFYPEACREGTCIIMLNCSDAGMTVDEEFFVDLSKEPDGAIRAHEVRYPGGDCTSDIYL
ncbi:hypothetical protein RvY_11757 [Ramazzottius varieornatus]|uniref:Methanethiol oxidase n=1 Tax=Ramazzottius varieornatus TaxID=947166 RepID=A0A1D1VMJ6_RAMVA|nr:hypothetical protein RvY_11757 [Ramazzottius varieornatus]